jgi:hypothetical protein
MPFILWDWDIHNRVYKGPPLEVQWGSWIKFMDPQHILGRLNVILILQSCYQPARGRTTNLSAVVLPTCPRSYYEPIRSRATNLPASASSL